MRSSASPVLWSVLLGIATLPAQIKPGNSIVSVARTTSVGELWEIDHQAGTATQLTISAALAADVPNCIRMLAGGLGFVGTNPLAPGTGSIYRIIVSGQTVTETKLNTTPTADVNVAQLALVGGSLFFTTSALTGTVSGILQSVPVAGGPVVQELDISTVSGASGLANALTAIGPLVFIGTWDVGTATNPGSLIQYDTTTKKGSLVLQLPKSKSGTGTGNPGIVNMRQHPTRPNLLILQGIYGDWFLIDPFQAQIVDHAFSGFPGPSSNTANSYNSFDYDPHTGDYVVGTRDDHVERVVSNHAAEKIVKLSTATSSVNGTAHIPLGNGHDHSTGPGCPGSGGYTLTDVSYGLPTAGNGSFAFGVHSGYGGNPVALVFGLTDPKLPLDPVPMPGCVLHTDFFATIPAVLTGTGNGLGKARIPLAIPASALGAKLYRQWFEAQLGGTKSNPAGIVVSNGREIQVQ